jgi:uncharacterized coiled-coil DUF342 family protein
MLRDRVRRLDIAASWQRARAQFASMVAERDRLKSEVIEIRRERDEFRRCLRELQTAVQERWAAEQRLAALHRERALYRAERAERDLSKPLH